jgi:hypothetical protein
MKDDLWPAIIAATALTFILGWALGYGMGKQEYYDRCFEHFNYMTVVEARGQCNNILKGK